IGAYDRGDCPDRRRCGQGADPARVRSRYRISAATGASDSRTRRRRIVLTHTLYVRRDGLIEAGHAHRGARGGDGRLRYHDRGRRGSRLPNVLTMKKPILLLFALGAGACKTEPEKTAAPAVPASTPRSPNFELDCAPSNTSNAAVLFCVRTDTRSGEVLNVN